MIVLELLRFSIRNRIPISFEYNKPGKIVGIRYGFPHVIYIFTSHKGEMSTKVHILQTKGVTDSPKEEFPFWRPFNLEHICNVLHMTDESKFKIQEGYNPEWKEYQHIIEKI